MQRNLRHRECAGHHGSLPGPAGPVIGAVREREIPGPYVGPHPSTAWSRRSRLTQSNWCLCPNGNSAGTYPTWTSTLPYCPALAPSRQRATRRHRRCSHPCPAPTPPASATCRQHWPGPAHLPDQHGGPPVHPTSGGGPGLQVKAAPHWTPGDDLQKRHGYGRGLRW